MKVAALCAGYGGLELGLGLAGIDHELAWYADIDPSASTVMASNHPGTPNYGDLCAITNPPVVDTVTAGFPCQPVSVSGRREGTDDERWIIDDVCRVARSAGARTLVLENVPGLLTANDGNAMARVCAAMARHGYRRWKWGTLRASDIGAPHRRKRWFCVAHSDEQGPQRGSRPQRGMGPIDRLANICDGSVSDTHGIGRYGGSREAGRETGQRTSPSRPSQGTAANPDGATIRPQPIGVTRRSDPTEPRPDHSTTPHIHDIRQGQPHAGRCDRERFGDYAEAVNRWETILGRRAPDPTVDGRLSPLFVEWMMGLPGGWVTGHVDRRHALQVLGNGVVPQQAAAAITALWDAHTAAEEAAA